MRLLASLAPTKIYSYLQKHQYSPTSRRTFVGKFVRKRALRKFERIFVMQNLLNVMYVGYATVGFELLRKSKCVPQIYERRAVTHDHCTGTNFHTSKQSYEIYKDYLLCKHNHVGRSWRIEMDCWCGTQAALPAIRSWPSGLWVPGKLGRAHE